MSAYARFHNSDVPSNDHNFIFEEEKQEGMKGILMLGPKYIIPLPWMRCFRADDLYPCTYFVAGGFDPGRENFVRHTEMPYTTVDNAIRNLKASLPLYEKLIGDKVLAREILDKTLEGFARLPFKYVSLDLDELRSMDNNKEDEERRLSLWRSPDDYGQFEGYEGYNSKVLPYRAEDYEGDGMNRRAPDHQNRNTNYCILEWLWEGEPEHWDSWRAEPNKPVVFDSDHWQEWKRKAYAFPTKSWEQQALDGEKENEEYRVWSLEQEARRAEELKQGQESVAAGARSPEERASHEKQKKNSGLARLLFTRTLVFFVLTCVMAFALDGPSLWGIARNPGQSQGLVELVRPSNHGNYVEYSYGAGGNQYAGRMTPSSFDLTPFSVDLKKGQAVTVYFDRSSPETSTLRDPEAKLWEAMLESVAVGLIFAFTFGYLQPRKKRGKE